VLSNSWQLSRLKIKSIIELQHLRFANVSRDFEGNCKSSFLQKIIDFKKLKILDNNFGHKDDAIYSL
jgi:hypothetical protein